MRLVAVSDGVNQYSNIDEDSNKMSEAKDGEYIINRPMDAAVLLSTGGLGTSLFYLLGVMLMGIAGAGLVMKRNRRTV